MRDMTTTRRQIAAGGLLAFGCVLISAPVFAAGGGQHLRGQVTAVTDSGFTMKTRAGKTRQVATSGDTGYGAVVPGDLSNIEKGTFIGTANVEQGGKNQALEMVIFPPSMKGTGLGDYAWDLSPAEAKNSQKSSNGQNAQMAHSGTGMAGGSSMTNGTVTAKQNGGSMQSGSSMTNGSVTAKSSNSQMAGGSSMTNGTVTSQSGQGGQGNQMLTLNVDYGKGSKKIVVPADVPVVKVQAGKKSDVTQGAHVFVAGTMKGDQFQAARVIVGKQGAIPPM